mmetsp:Transcript_19069/g.33102  ORF Transcript_19069/g.33102 Transcript_19069/m.33102 type:complete len:214 (+) Transcript_19069:1685-2326(+)
MRRQHDFPAVLQGRGHPPPRRRIRRRNGPVPERGRRASGGGVGVQSARQPLRNSVPVPCNSVTGPGGVSAEGCQRDSPLLILRSLGSRLEGGVRRRNGHFRASHVSGDAAKIRDTAIAGPRTYDGHLRQLDSPGAVRNQLWSISGDAVTADLAGPQLGAHQSPGRTGLSKAQASDTRHYMKSASAKDATPKTSLDYADGVADGPLANASGAPG